MLTLSVFSPQRLARPVGPAPQSASLAQPVGEHQPGLPMQLYIPPQSLS